MIEKHVLYFHRWSAAKALKHIFKVNMKLIFYFHDVIYFRVN